MNFFVVLRNFTFRAFFPDLFPHPFQLKDIIFQKNSHIIVDSLLLLRS